MLFRSCEAAEFSCERVTAKVDAYYGFVIRRLAARGELPASFHSAIPPSQRVLIRDSGIALEPGVPMAPEERGEPDEPIEPSAVSLD